MSNYKKITRTERFTSAPFGFVFASDYSMTNTFLWLLIIEMVRQGR